MSQTASRIIPRLGGNFILIFPRRTRWQRLALTPSCFHFPRSNSVNSSAQICDSPWSILRRGTTVLHRALARCTIGRSREHAICPDSSHLPFSFATRSSPLSARSEEHTSELQSLRHLV